MTHHDSQPCTLQTQRNTQYQILSFRFAVTKRWSLRVDRCRIKEPSTLSEIVLGFLCLHFLVCIDNSLCVGVLLTSCPILQDGLYIIYFATICFTVLCVITYGIISCYCAFIAFYCLLYSRLCSLQPEGNNTTCLNGHWNSAVADGRAPAEPQT